MDSSLLKKYGLLLLIFFVLLIFVVPYIMTALIPMLGNNTSAAYYASLIAIGFVMLLAFWLNNKLQKSNWSMKV